MKLDLLKDQKSLLKYIKTRIRDYPVYENAGPGEDDASISQITLGYQFDQAGWAAMVFDTRVESAVDGVWQNYIEENEYELPHWHDACEALCEKGGTVKLIRSDGSNASVSSDENLAELFGVFLQDLLMACRDDGRFDSLPLAPDCRLTVEEHEGQYGWSDAPVVEHDDNGDDLSAVSEDLKTKTAALPQSKQIAFWTERLRQIAEETDRDPEDFDFDVDGNVDQLAAVGADAVVPMLKLAVDLAAKSQFEGDGGQARELYRSWVLDQLIQKVEEMEHATSEIEKLLRQIVTRAVKVNSSRKLWGTAPFFAARALFNLFDGYPCPELGDDDNALLDPAPFVVAEAKRK